VILCHKRTWHLKKVLDALSLCPEVKESEVIFVAQDSPSEVLDIINDFKFAKKTLLKFNNLAFKSSAHAINHNLFAGLKEGFLGKQSKYCIVLDLIAPIYSKILNIGFDESATHSANDSKLGNLMEKSFRIGLEKAPTQVKEIKTHYQHPRKDLCVISSLSKLQSIQLYLLREISFKLYKLALKDKSRIHFIWRKFRNFTDQRFSNVSQASST